MIINLKNIGEVVKACIIQYVDLNAKFLTNCIEIDNDQMTLHVNKIKFSENKNLNKFYSFIREFAGDFGLFIKNENESEINFNYVKDIYLANYANEVGGGY